MKFVNVFIAGAIVFLSASVDAGRGRLGAPGRGGPQGLGYQQQEQQGQGGDCPQGQDCQQQQQQQQQGQVGAGQGFQGGVQGCQDGQRDCQGQQGAGQGFQGGQQQNEGLFQGAGGRGGGCRGGRCGYNEDEFVDLTTICPSLTPCELPDGSEGVFVCREIDVRPWDDDEAIDLSVCVPVEAGWQDDRCGCCGTCPDACMDTICDITYRNGTTVMDGGVLVSVTNRLGDEQERCVTSGASLRLVALGIGTCV